MGEPVPPAPLRKEPPASSIRAEWDTAVGATHQLTTHPQPPAHGRSQGRSLLAGQLMRTQVGNEDPGVLSPVETPGETATSVLCEPRLLLGRPRSVLHACGPRPAVPPVAPGEKAQVFLRLIPTTGAAFSLRPAYFLRASYCTKSTPPGSTTAVPVPRRRPSLSCFPKPCRVPRSARTVFSGSGFQLLARGKGRRTRTHTHTPMGTGAARGLAASTYRQGTLPQQPHGHGPQQQPPVWERSKEQPEPAGPG